MSDLRRIPADVLQAFETVAPEPRSMLLDVRAMIFEVAWTCSDIGPIEETLRWGEPAYLTRKKRTGSTMRLAIEKTTGKPASVSYTHLTLPTILLV